MLDTASRCHAALRNLPHSAKCACFYQSIPGHTASSRDGKRYNAVFLQLNSSLPDLLEPRPADEAACHLHPAIPDRNRLRQRWCRNQPNAVHCEPAGLTGSRPCRLAGCQLRSAHARAFHADRRYPARRGDPGHWSTAAFRSSETDDGTDFAAHRRRMHGQSGRLPYLQHPDGGRPQGRAGADFRSCGSHRCVSYRCNP